MNERLEKTTTQERAYLHLDMDREVYLLRRRKCVGVHLDSTLGNLGIKQRVHHKASGKNCLNLNVTTFSQLDLTVLVISKMKAAHVPREQKTAASSPFLRAKGEAALSARN